MGRKKSIVSKVLFSSLLVVVLIFSLASYYTFRLSQSLLQEYVNESLISDSNVIAESLDKFFANSGTLVSQGATNGILIDYMEIADNRNAMSSFEDAASLLCWLSERFLISATLDCNSLTASSRFCCPRIDSVTNTATTTTMNMAIPM